MFDRKKMKDKTPSDKTFVRVKTPSQGKALLREPAGGLLYETGRLLLNNDASDILDEIVRNTPNLSENWVPVFEANEDTKLVAMKPMPSGAEGGTRMRRTDRASSSQVHNYTLFLDGVFLDHPGLRPTGRVKVKVGYDVDANGELYLEINLQNTVAAPVIHRDGTTDSPEEEDEEE